MGDETNHKRYLLLADGAVGLRSKDVLEIGGSTPLEHVLGTGCASWTSVNLNPAAVDALNDAAKSAGATNVSSRYQDAALIDDHERYDVVYSINAFEHIRDIENTINRAYASLRPTGTLFTIFGPIWSCDVGHHLSVRGDNGELHFQSGALEPFEHLTSTPAEMLKRLRTKHSEPTAHRIVEYVYEFGDLNRLFEYEYDALLAASSFSPLFVFRRRGPHAPPQNRSHATRTRELLWVLKKGRGSLWEKGRTFCGFSLAYLRSRQ